MMVLGVYRRVVIGLCGLLGSALIGLALPLGAQQTPGGTKSTRCTLVEQPNTRLSVDSTAAGQVAFVGGGAFFKCPGRNIELRGDSAERYPDHDAMIGHSVYDEPRFHVTSDFLNYFPDSEKVIAVGNVNARMPSGSTLVGPIAIYRRAVPRVRKYAQMEAKARPTITVIEKDSAGRPSPPMTVVADSVLMDGDSLIYGRGRVVINRPEISSTGDSVSVTATGDSVFVDETRETMRLMRGPELRGRKDRPFSLKGDVIDLYSTNRKLQRVIARGNAIAVSEMQTLTSDTIDLRVKNDLLEHAYVWGTKSRARAVSPTQNMLADSLDVTMPGQQMRLVRALRRAVAQTKIDTTRFALEKADTTDWLRGDTIIAHFDSAPPKPAVPTPKDTAKGPQIRQLVASGNASSLYHLAASDTGERRPAIHYSSARTITIDFLAQTQKVGLVTTRDSVVGVFIDPTKTDSTGRRAPGAAPGTKTPPKTPPSTPVKPAIPPSVVPLPPKKP
ncbi:MAG TPA: hypothetical protein VK636_00120 [Gemmatimonadaceae bacterium]|nr:hypothetical protein [Gemmatimonadaceae bacterium]